MSFGQTCSIDSSISCKYDPDSCPGSDEIIYTVTCNCVDTPEDGTSGQFICASAFFACPPEEEVKVTCPSTLPDTNDPCDGPTTCRYNAFSCPGSDDISFIDTCDCVQNAPDGPFLSVCASARIMCPPTATPSVCPVDAPSTGGDCMIDETIECSYDPFGCPGSTDNGVFLTKCQCDNGNFICSAAGVNCDDDDDKVPPTPVNPVTSCPDKAPNFGDACEGSCRYSPFSCPGSDDIEFTTKCECVQDSPDAPFYNVCVISLSVCGPTTEPSVCPVSAPLNREDCTAEQADTVCKYDPFGCPGSTDDAVFLTNCDCVDGKYICSQALPICEESDDSGASFNGICFSGESLVEVQGSTTTEDRLIPMKDLRIGDMVRTAAAGNGADVYESVYSFGHYAPDTIGDFLEIHFAEADIVTSPPLQISPKHMVAVKSHGFVPASSLKIGDQVVGENDTDLIVSSIQAGVKALGVFAPFTPSGTIMVNGVVSSSFVAMRSSDKISVFLSIGSVEITHQWVAHSFEFPHRAVCHYMGKCPNEMYDEHGISVWVSAPHKASQWLLNDEQSTVFKVLVLSILLVVLFAFAVLELLFLRPMSVVFLVVVVYKLLLHGEGVAKSKAL